MFSVIVKEAKEYKGVCFMAALPHSGETAIGELVQSGLYGEYANYIFTYMTPDHWRNRLSAYGYEKVGFEAGLLRMRELAARSRELHFPVYPEEERLASWDKATVTLEYFPAEKTGKALPYVLILPGGGFNRQWGFIEGQAVAARANALGYPAFVLYYRVKQEPLMPLPVEDACRAVRYIDAHADSLGVQAGKYMVGGFSAGAAITACLLTKRFGWEAGGIPRPAAVFLGYGPMRYDEFYRAWEEAPAGSPAREGCAAVLRRVGGPGFTMDTLSPYNIIERLNPDSPPVYVTANLDDPTVPVVNSLELIEALKENHIEHKAKIGRTGGHSYGLGNGLEVAGWFDEAIALFAEHC